MTKRTVSKSSPSVLSIDTLRSVAGGETTTPVAPKDLDANNNKKPYQLTYKFAPEMI
jgi:hypothetical protein